LPKSNQAQKKAGERNRPQELASIKVGQRGHDVCDGERQKEDSADNQGRLLVSTHFSPLASDISAARPTTSVGAEVNGHAFPKNELAALFLPGIRHAGGKYNQFFIRLDVRDGDGGNAYPSFLTVVSHQEIHFVRSIGLGGNNGKFPATRTLRRVWKPI
jgi:hypothetical protein